MRSSSRKEDLQEVARSMAATLRHRGPDDHGTWVDAPAGVALGHTRLAILDLSAEGHQPMPSHAGDHILVFNGEIYNYRDLRNRLEGAGTRFRGTSDTEVLLEAIARWGTEAALEQTNGMFALALWNRSERTLTIARDRLGEKPLYYGMLGSQFVFASEMKALRAHPSFDRDVDRRAVTAFLRHNYIPAPLSIYEGVYKLPPGHTAVISPGDRLQNPRPFWDARALAEAAAYSPLDGPPSVIADRLEELLLDSTRLRMISDVPLGAFLSGGIDSSLIVALMQRQSERPVRTFSIGFHEHDYNEAQHAGQVARHLGTDHTELYVAASEAIAVIPTLPQLYDEPFADSSQIPTMLVSALAREHVTVALSGDGGDELFGGYTRYLFHRQIWDRIQRLPVGLRTRVGRALQRPGPATWDGALSRLGPMLPSQLRQSRAGDKVHKFARVLASGTPEDVYLGLMSHWEDPANVVVGGQEPPTALNDPGRWAQLSTFSDRLMYLDTVSYLPDDILVKVDRASMSRSLEVRVPLLDHRIVEFAWRLPLDLKLRGNEGKWLLRQVLYRHVPSRLVDRPKMGFGVPIGEWLRGPLRPWAEDLLDAGRLRRQGLLRPEPIRSRWQEHLSGDRDWKYHLWDVLMLQSWLDAEAPAPTDGAGGVRP